MKPNLSNSLASSLGPSSLIIATTLVIFSWSLFFWLPFTWCLLVLMPFVSLCVWAVVHDIRQREPRMQIRISIYSLFWVTTILLCIAAPFYSYWYGYQRAERIFESLQIDATIAKEEMTFFDRLHGFDYGAPPRSISIIYDVKEPLSEAEAKIYRTFEDRIDWHVEAPDTNSNVIYAFPLIVDAWCPFYNSFGTGLSLRENGQLLIYYQFGTATSCTEFD